MGCVQIRSVRPLQIRIDLGNVPSSTESSPTESSVPVISPITREKIRQSYNKRLLNSDFVKFRRNNCNCYFCNENDGLLLRMLTCKCKFWAHFACMETWILNDNSKCTICNENYYSGESRRRDYRLRRALSLSTLNSSQDFYLAHLYTMHLIRGGKGLETQKKNTDTLPDEADLL